MKLGNAKQGTWRALLVGMILFGWGSSSAAQFASATSAAPSRARHDAASFAWGWSSAQYFGTNFQFQVNVDRSNHNRVLDVHYYDHPNQRIGVTKLNALAGTPYDLDWGIDYPVNKAQAVAAARANGMRIACVDGFVDSQGNLAFISLREEDPMGTSWAWVPDDSIAGIQAWLAANPEFQPYSVDSVRIVGIRHYSVLAHASAAVGTFPRPILRASRLVFGRSAAELEQLIAADPRERIIDVDQIGIDIFDAVVERLEPDEPFAPMGFARAPYDSRECCVLERAFAVSGFNDPMGVTHESALYVNNVPPVAGFHEFRYGTSSVSNLNCSNISAMLMSVSTPQGGPTLGSTLAFESTTFAWAPIGQLILGFEREGLDLSAFTHYPVTDPFEACILVPYPVAWASPPIAAVAGRLRRSVVLPTDPALIGTRFYAQFLSYGNTSGRFELSVATNYYCITIQ